MIGQIVKGDPGIIRFLYPSFQEKSSLSYSDLSKDIIYTGPTRRELKKYLASSCNRFISTTGAYEVDISTPKQLLEWVCLRKSIELRQSVLDTLDSYDDEELIFLIKQLWVTGRWLGSNTESVSIYQLFQGTVGPLKDLLKTYYLLRESIPHKIIEASFITFLSRVVNMEEQNVSQGYMKLLRTAHMKYGSKLRPAIFKFSTRKDKNDELKFLDLLLDLR